MKAKVGEQKFVSLIMDGSTDISVIEQEIVYIRYFKAGDVGVNFIGIVRTPKADAVGVTASLGKVKCLKLNLHVMPLLTKPVP